MSTTAPAAGARKPRVQIMLSVVRTERLSPHLVRIVLGGAGFDEFESNDKTDKYVKMLFTDIDGHQVTRTYTVREVNSADKTISIDFVVHGDEGLAGPWAAAAKPGDVASVSGPGGGYAPDPTADWHLLAGDESALPAIASALDALPATARGVAFIETYADADVLDLRAPAGVEVRWLLRGDRAAGETTLLADAVAQYSWLPGRVHVFAHGERGAMKQLRDVFKHRGVTRTQLSLSGYWAFGRTEDRFQAEKREPVGVIEPVSD
ncbi:NADPH-dependent ferric siderophore reductase, contains FAD-binding and SIP domains [Agreia bicolorata]|uniref:FAD-binding protein n=1 Tax=Agreia bicolorata TaxID=110935 RepID=A0A1T4YKZ5_9MICO|nr:siderophore-interacting protein [Agreia bicolorata]KJC65761.1 FAD-binding protein [Agreia bicolorata]SKB02228.1 NADPH-dependent ferric siderophore reductase, contains FAD-binding and SIP domains [Agreia bicolorata]